MDLEIVLKNSEGVVVSSYKAKAETSTEYLEEGDQRACSLMWSRDLLVSCDVMGPRDVIIGLRVM